MVQGMKEASEGELMVWDVRIQKSEQKLESGGWLSMTETPVPAQPPHSAGGFNFVIKQLTRPQQLQVQQGQIEQLLTPRPEVLSGTPRSAFFASKKVPSNVKSGIEVSLSQMKHAWQTKDTIRRAMKGLSSDIEPDGEPRYKLRLTSSRH